MFSILSFSFLHRMKKEEDITDQKIRYNLEGGGAFRKQCKSLHEIMSYL